MVLQDVLLRIPVIFRMTLKADWSLRESDVLMPKYECLETMLCRRLMSLLSGVVGR